MWWKNERKKGGQKMKFAISNVILDEIKAQLHVFYERLEDEIEEIKKENNKYGKPLKLTIKSEIIQNDQNLQVKVSLQVNKGNIGIGGIKDISLSQGELYDSPQTYKIRSDADDTAAEVAEAIVKALEASGGGIRARICDSFSDC